MISNESQTFGFFNELSQFLFRNWLTKVAHGLYVDYNLASTNGPLWASICCTGWLKIGFQINPK